MRHLVGRAQAKLRQRRVLLILGELRLGLHLLLVATGAAQLLLRGGRGRLAALFGCVSVSLRSTGVEMIVPFGIQYLTLWQSLAYPEAYE